MNKKLILRSIIIILISFAIVLVSFFLFGLKTSEDYAMFLSVANLGIAWVLYLIDFKNVHRKKANRKHTDNIISHLISFAVLLIYVLIV